MTRASWRRCWQKPSACLQPGHEPRSPRSSPPGGGPGLLDAVPKAPATFRLGDAAEPVPPAPRPRPVPPDFPVLQIADRRVSLAVAIPDGLSGIAAWFPTLPTARSGSGELVDHAVRLTGTCGDWRLWLDGDLHARGSTRDAALLALISVLSLIGARPAKHLLLVHGAGLVAPDGRGLLLVAPGGSGKTTLAAALDAAGFGLLSDDVVPVTPDGDLLGLGLPLCLKAGSWPVLAERRPDLEDAPVIQRFGEPVRFLPPRTPAPAAPVTPALLLLTRYQPGQAPRIMALDPPPRPWPASSPPKRCSATSPRPGWKPWRAGSPASRPGA